jgi:hypothetical protein
MGGPAPADKRSLLCTAGAFYWDVLVELTEWRSSEAHRKALLQIAQLQPSLYLHLQLLDVGDLACAERQTLTRPGSRSCS